MNRILRRLQAIERIIYFYPKGVGTQWAYMLEKEWTAEDEELKNFGYIKTWKEDVRIFIGITETGFLYLNFYKI